jgi:hypothetical protein
MDRNRLIQAVKVRMDEITPDDSINVVDNPLVDQLIDEQVLSFLEFMPPDLLECKYNIDVQLVGFPDGHGDIFLPEDFLKLVRVRMGEWDKAVTLTINENSPLALMQNHRYTRGGTKRPVVIRSHNPSGHRVLRYFSVVSNHSLQEFVYIPKMKAEEVGDNLLDPLAWYIASVAFQVLENMEASKMAMARVVEYIKSHM